MQRNSISKLKQLKSNLKKMDSVAIGFSGGVDSSFLLKVASETLGKKTVAVTISSSFHPEKELENGKKLAKTMNVKHLIINLDIGKIENFKENPSDRCYHCKKHIFSKIKEVVKKENIAYVLDASNYDDLQDYRPGINALEKLGVISPLIDVKLTKKEIRDLSKKMNLDTWNKPSIACLASRFPYGIYITKKRLMTVEKAEDIIQSLGVKQVRVRYHTETARIELLKNDFQIILKYSEEIVKQFKSLGFKYITLDIEGYRTGSLNEVIIP